MFELRVADNFHYADPDETYTQGRYATYPEAVAAARRLVEASHAEAHQPGMAAAALFAAYTMFGDDPFVIPEPAGEHFSAWEYARRRCDELCGDPEAPPG